MLQLVTKELPLDQNNVYIDGELILTFNKPLDPASILLGQTFFVYITNTVGGDGNNAQPFAASVTIDTDKIIVNPDTFFPTNQTMALVAVGGANGIKALDTDTLQTALVVAFKTGSLLSPDTEATTESAEEINKINEASSDFVSKVFPGESSTVVVADVDLQGEILPHIICPPNFEGSDLGDEVVTGGDSALPSVITGNRLLLRASNPVAYSVGVTDVSEVITVWDKDIAVAVTPPLEMSYQEVPMSDDPFLVNPVPHNGGPVVVVEKSVTQGFDVSGFTDTTNKEFTVKIKAGNLKSTDNEYTNVTETIVFSGVLKPILCSLDQAKATAGMWGATFTAKDNYYYYKLLHEISVYTLSLAGYTDVSQITDAKEKNQLSRYVCCSMALRLLAYGSPDTSDESINPSNPNIYVKKRDLPGVSITYDVMGGSSSSSSSSDSASPISQMMKRLDQCIKENAPAGTEITDLGTHGIRWGNKSKMDRRYPIPRRL